MAEQGRRWRGYAAVAVALSLLAPAAPAAADPVAVGGDASPVLAKLDTLPIKGRAPKTGYERALFGQAWSDDVTVPEGHNGCDTRFLGGFGVLGEMLQIAFKQGALR